MDLPVPERAPAGDRHRRRGAQAVPLPRRLADAPRQREVRRHGPLRARAAAGCAAASSATSATAPRSTGPCVLASAVRLLERGFFRIGSEEYAAENESYGLATLRKEHVTVERRRPDGLRLPGQERAAPPPGRRRTSASARSSPRSSGGAAAATSCSPTRRAGAGTTCAPTTSTSTSRRRPAATSPPRTSAPGTRPRWPPSRWRCPARRRATKTARKRAVKRAIEEVAQLPRQHARGVPRLLHRPARVRRLRAPASRSARRSSASPRGCGRASCRSTSRRSRRPCSTSSPSGTGRPAPWSGSPPEQQPAQRRPGRHAVHDDRDQHGGDARSTRRAPARRRPARPRRRSPRGSRACRRRARRTRRRTPSRRAGPCCEPTRRQQAGERPHDARAAARRAASPPSRIAPRPGEREHRAEQQDHGELEQLLHPLGALVDRRVELVVALVAAEREPAGEHGEEAVAAGELGEPVDHERGGDRVEAVERRRRACSRLRSRLTLQAASTPTAAPIASPIADRVDDVGGEPLPGPAAAALLGHEDAEQHERARPARR